MNIAFNFVSFSPGNTASVGSISDTPTEVDRLDCDPRADVYFYNGRDGASFDGSALVRRASRSVAIRGTIF